MKVPPIAVFSTVYSFPDVVICLFIMTKPGSPEPARDATNTLFNLAVDLVTHSNRSIFLTGKAGTGKTTFLKWIREHCLKQLAVVAPTGVAAINAGGVTIHSFFQLPLAAFIPEGESFSSGRDEFVNPYDLVSRLKIQKDKIRVLQELELLIIDEISMVRCDTLDAIDTVLKHTRQSPEPFGGVQLLFIGDLYQLPPVIREETWDALRRYYPSPYFFDSRATSGRAPIYIEFDKIYRQSEERFIRLLNQVRNNDLDAEGLQILEERYQPNYHRQPGDGVITLTTHNEKAREINNREIDSIHTPAFRFDASIDGEFPDNFFPADQQLVLKIGAQVMFIRNDPDRTRRYFNGKIGVVMDIVDEVVHVQCLDGSPVIEVKREKWENIRYMVNVSNRKLEEDVLGSFAQYPLRLAWAITIHKSQGLTFEKAIIDAGRSFASGQVYVALSRCTSLDGLILQSRVQAGGFYTDRRIVEFAERRSSIRELEAELIIARGAFIRDSLEQLFNFSQAVQTVIMLDGYVNKHRTSFGDAFVWMGQVLNEVRSIEEVATRFRSWLVVEFERPAHELNAGLIQLRINKAATWFRDSLEKLTGQLKVPGVSTDSATHARVFNESIRELFGLVSMKHWVFGELRGMPDAEQLQEIKTRFVLPGFTVNAYGGPGRNAASSPHPLLHAQLRKLRDQFCSQRDLPVYLVASAATIDELAEYLPLTEGELQRIKGFGPVRVKAYGKEFLDAIQDYCDSHGIGTAMDSHPGSPKKKAKESDARLTASTNESREAKVPTARISLEQFRAGTSIGDIASQRGFKPQTIESHLAGFIASGELEITSLLSRERYMAIEPVLLANPGEPLSILKQRLGDGFQYAEIRFALASLEAKSNGLAQVSS